MNALFGPCIKGFLTRLQAQDTLREDHGDDADGVDGKAAARVEFGGHAGLYRATPRLFSAGLSGHACRSDVRAFTRDNLR